MAICTYIDDKDIQTFLNDQYRYLVIVQKILI